MASPHQRAEVTETQSTPMRRRRVLAAVGTGVLGSAAGCSGSAEQSEPAFRIASPPLEERGEIPVRFTCDGAGQSPPIRIERVPEPTASLAVVAEYDRGVINEPVFWTLWNVPPQTDRIPAGLPRTPAVDSLSGARQGRQPGREVGYEPPCPPAGQPYEHRFQVYALSKMLDLDGGAKQDAAVEAIGSAVLASRRITVEYTHPVTDTNE